MTQGLGWLRAAMAPALAIALSCSVTAPAQAQIPGLLPSIDEIAPLDPLPIDGVWEIREIRERIVIDSGHAYAVDGWTHALIFRIMPRQVVIRDLRETDDGSYVGDDLPLMSKVELTPMPDGTLRARTRGLIPATYTLVPVDGDDGGPWDPPVDDDDDFDDLPGDGPDPGDDDYVSPW